MIERPNPKTTAEIVAAAILDEVEHMARSLENSREVMNTKEAAEFLRMDISEFRRLSAAGQIPRHQISERRFLYVRSELLSWLLSR